MTFYPKAKYALAMAACSLLGAGARAQSAAPDSPKAEQAYLAGARLLDHKQLADARAEFAKAVALDPKRQEYALALNLTAQNEIVDLVHRAAAERLNHQDANAELLLARARAIDPDNELVRQHTDAGPASRTRIEPVNQPRFLPPIQIAPTAAVKDLDSRGDVRQAVTQTAAAFGVRVVFDDSVVAQALRFNLQQTTYAQAMPILLRMAHLIGVAVDEHTLLVAKDTQENRDKYERQVEETIYIPGAEMTQLNEFSSIIKNVFDVKQVFISPIAGALIVRAPENIVQAVNYTIADLADGPAEVMLRVQLVSVDKTHQINTGISTPNSVNAFSIAAEAQSIVSSNQSAVQQLLSSGLYVPPTGASYIQIIESEALALVLSGVVQDANLTNLLAFFGGGLTFFGASYTGTTSLNFGLTSSQAYALEDVNLRVGDHQLTTLRVGEKYPITTSTYGSGLSNSTLAALAGKTINGVSASSLISQLTSAQTATVPIIQYEDLGLTLKATPSVAKSGLIDVKLELKIEALTGASLNNIPLLTSRSFTSEITVPDGGSAIMLSDLSKTEEASISGLPGLGSLPGFQGVTDDRVKEVDSSELVLMVSPTITRRRKSSIASIRYAIVPSVPPES